MEPIKLAVLPLNDAKNLQEQLSKKGIELILNHNEQTCNRGCSITVEILAFEKDLEAVRDAYQESYQKLTDGHDVNWEVANSVFDHSSAEAICPACGFTFVPTTSECPDCGLNLG